MATEIELLKAQIEDYKAERLKWIALVRDVAIPNYSELLIASELGTVETSPTIAAFKLAVDPAALAEFYCRAALAREKVYGDWVSQPCQACGVVPACGAGS